MSPTAPKGLEPDGAAAELGEPPAVVASAPAPGAEPVDQVQGLLDQVAEGTEAGLETERAPLPAVALPSAVTLRTAEPLGIRGRIVTIRCRGVEGQVLAELGRGVARELVAQAVREGNAVLVESAPGEAPLVVGVVQIRWPDELSLHARTVRIEAEQEVLLRAGRGAVRIRQDGEIEIVGSRIAALSRGLFRLVGRVLRLN